MQRSVRSGQQAVGEDKVSQIGEYASSPLFTDREKVALRYADAITWDPSQADDAMWLQLKQHFTEPELVELGFLIGVLCGGQRWISTLDLRHGDSSSTASPGGASSAAGLPASSHRPVDRVARHQHVQSE